MFDYLSQFWNAIVSVVVGGATYGIDFFQQIGNAVAGAIGLVILLPLRYVVEFFLAIGWIISNLISILGMLLSPISYLFIFLKVFIQAILTTPASSNLFTVNAQALTALTQLPYWSTLTSILIALIAVAGVVATVKNANL